MRFKERDIAGWAAPDISRAGLSFVPQERNVFGTMSVAENLEMGGYIDGAHARQRMAELYERFPMLADKRRAAARTLSGGQRQILAMAVALMNAPDLLLLDEPTAGLSPRAAEELFGTILALNQSGVAILMVEQNALEALSVSARAYVLVQGRPEREGRAADLAADPTVRDLFLGGKAAPMLESSNEGMGDSHMTGIRIGRRRGAGGGVAAVASPAVVRAQADPIKLATLTPLTGAGGSYGPTMAKVAAAVVEEVNKAGGVLGRRIVLVSEDDQTSPEAGVRAARKLIDVDKAAAIMGTWASSVTTAVAPLCWESKTFLTHHVGRRFDHAAAAPGLSRAHPAQLDPAGDALGRVHAVAGRQEGLHHDPADALHPGDLRPDGQGAAQGRRHAPGPDLRRQEERPTAPRSTRRCVRSPT